MVGSKKTTKYTVGLFGGTDTGKSALVLQYTESPRFGREFGTSNPTVQAQSTHVTKVNEQLCSVDLIETGGTITYGMVLDDNIDASDGFIVTYNITNSASLAAAECYLHEILERRGVCEGGVVSTPPTVVVGCMSDLGCNRMVAECDGRFVATTYNCEFAELSTTDGDACRELFEGLVSALQCERGYVAPSERKKSAKCVVM